MQESCYHPQRVLCITFGAPPTFMTAQATSQAVMPDNEFSDLYWNFLIAHLPLNAEQANLTVEDAVPVLFSSVPLSCQTKQRWIEAVNDVVRNVSGNSADLQESIGRMLRAGAVPRHFHMRQSSAQ